MWLGDEKLFRCKLLGFPIGSKQHIMSQCVYFAVKIIVLSGVIFPKKHVFLKRNFQVIFLKLSIYCIYSFPNISNFFIIKFGEIWIFESAQILPNFVFVLKICHNFKSYQNMLTLSSLIFYIIRYKFF